MTDEQLMQDAYDALCVAFPGMQGFDEWEKNETLRAALRERLAQLASGQEPVVRAGNPDLLRALDSLLNLSVPARPIVSGQGSVSALEEQRLYKELLYAVASAFPNETCHETALRYIRNAEAGNNNAEALLPGKEKP